MKKLASLLMLAVLLAFGITLSSCGGGGDEKDADIIGTWKEEYTKSQYRDKLMSEGSTRAEANDQISSMEFFGTKFPLTVYEIDFLANGTVNFYNIDNKDGARYLDDTGTYVAFDNTINILNSRGKI